MKARTALLLILTLTTAVEAADFQSAWPKQVERIWAGPEYWANPLQDWRISRGRLECVVSGANRNVNLLTHQLSNGAGAFEISVRLGLIDPSEKPD
ncbi:MAG: twin-arginine translocation pathway signal, partial [bacterium]|nr:twin-arginine translocation pathway signal [bacterium]